MHGKWQTKTPECTESKIRKWATVTQWARGKQNGTHTVPWNKLHKHRLKKQRRVKGSGEHQTEGGSKGMSVADTATQIMCGAISAQWRFPLELIKYLYCLLSMSQCSTGLSYQCDKRLMREWVCRRRGKRSRQIGKEKKQDRIGGRVFQVEFALSSPSTFGLQIYGQCHQLQDSSGGRAWVYMCVCVC